MPELPEVETVRRKLEKKLKGRCLKEIDIIYPRIFEGDDLDFVKKSLVGEHILGLKRRGKWLIFEFDDYYLLSHLRMEGKYLYRNAKDEVKSMNTFVLFLMMILIYVIKMFESLAGCT